MSSTWQVWYDPKKNRLWLREPTCVIDLYWWTYKDDVVLAKHTLTTFYGLEYIGEF